MCACVCVCVWCLSVCLSVCVSVCLRIRHVGTQVFSLLQVSKPRGVMPRLHQNECTPRAPVDPVTRQAHVSDDHKSVATRKRSVKGSSYGTWKEHAAMDGKQLTKIEECPIIAPVDEPRDPHGSEMQYIVLPHATMPTADMHISKPRPQHSRMNAMPPITASFGVEHEQAASKQWVWKRPASKPVKDYDSSFSGMQSSLPPDAS